MRRLEHAKVVALGDGGMHSAQGVVAPVWALLFCLEDGDAPTR